MMKNRLKQVLYNHHLRQQRIKFKKRYNRKIMERYYMVQNNIISMLSDSIIKLGCLLILRKSIQCTIYGKKLLNNNRISRKRRKGKYL